LHVNTFDRYREENSLVHQLDPRVKVLATILFILSNVLLPDGAWLAFTAAWLVILLAGFLAHLTPGYLFKRSLIALPFALAAVTVLFTIPGTAVATFSLFSRTITISDAGLVRFASIVTRSWLSVQGAIWLTATTQFPDLMHALRHLRVPQLLTAIISFMYRYLFVLADEAGRLLRAREARSAAPSSGNGGGRLLWRAKVAGGMVGQLFLRSFERSERVYNAMLARGYRGQLLTMNPHVMVTRDWLGLGTAVSLLTLIQVIGHFL
jgi:cobalt/nickel transport system permease protein